MLINTAKEINQPKNPFRTDLQTKGLMINQCVAPTNCILLIANLCAYKFNLTVLLINMAEIIANKSDNPIKTIPIDLMFDDACSKTVLW
jgi:hypothetical protein